MFSSPLPAALMASIISSAMAQQFVMYTPGNDDRLVERFDSILSPGTISGHVHQVFGANGVDPNMSYESLQKSTCTTVGAANGAQNSADHSVYWHPALFMQAKDGSGYIRVPTNGHKLYYKDAGSDNDEKVSPFEFPKGFRMLAGDATMRAAADDRKRQNITQWICHGQGFSNQGTDGGFPTGVKDCDAYPGFNGALHFPHCWNGKDFDQSSPFSHVAYPDGDIQNGKCPDTHPKRLPHIFMENQFDLHSIVDQVVPDSFTLAQGDPTGYGWHADFFNGWEQGAIPELFRTCPQGKYGNHDIGTCPSFKGGDKTNICTLPQTFFENVNTPGKFLPGCNPVSRVNPALRFAAAALGISTDNCNAAGSNSGSGSSNSASAPASSLSISIPIPSASKKTDPSSVVASVIGKVTGAKGVVHSTDPLPTTMAILTKPGSLPIVTDAPVVIETVIAKEVVTVYTTVYIKARHIRAHAARAHVRRS